MADTIKVRIEYNGGPGHAARIVDAETGTLIEGAFHLEIDAKDGPPTATITAYAYEMDITTNASIVKVCPICERELAEVALPIEAVTDQEPEGGE